MKREDLYQAVGQVDDAVLDRSEQGKKRAPQHRRPWWMGAVAAVLVAAVVGGFFLRPSQTPGVPGMAAKALSAVKYPKMAPYPDESAYWKPNGEFDDEEFSKVYDAWRESSAAQQREPGFAAGTETFFAQALTQLLSGAPGENRACSPVNLYLALGMLSEVTDGESRQQILDLLGVDRIETLRKQAGDVWNACYRNDGATTSILASSLWLNENVSYQPDTLDRIAEHYYASSYQGTMGSEELNRSYRDWLNEQTGGLLSDQVKDLKLPPQTVLALATTIRYQAKWRDEFNEEKTALQTFHGPDGDVQVDFMHQKGRDSYYWGEHFGAVGKPMDNDGGTMWLLLPEEGCTPEELVADPEVLAFLQAEDWKNQKSLLVNLALPKFDVSDKLDLKDSMKAMGITEVFDPDKADFSPLTTQVQGIWLDRATQGTRVAVDEEGVTAAAYTVMMECGSGILTVEDEIDFTLDRPFLFVLTGPDRLPLFAGVVNHPEI